MVNSQPARIADSNSRNTVSFSSARTTKRFPSSRWASAIQIGCAAQFTIKSHLKYSKEFEYDHDNDNYSNYVENSVHVGDSYQTECAVARIYRKPSRYSGFFRHAVGNAVDYAKVFSRSHDAVIRVYDAAGNVIETHEHAGER
jgi:hypothetical protein